MSQEGTPYLIVLRENNVIEIIRNFSETVLVDTKNLIEKISPSFGNPL